MNREELGNIIAVRAKPAGALFVKNNGHREDKEESRTEPDVGLEFDSAEDAQEFYSLYAAQTGFRIRIGQLYMSRVDGSVISRRFVCSKGGFQPNSRIGCPAFIKVQKNDSWKWILANIKKEHNHELGLPWEIRPPHIKRKAHPAPRLTNVASTRTGIRSLEEEDVCPLPSGIVDVKPFKRGEAEGVPKVEPYKGLEFSSANEAYKFYYSYAAKTGFKVRIGQLFRSKHNGSITSRRFVVGCGAFMRIQRQESGKWIVDCLQKEHNHSLDSTMDSTRLIAAALNGFREEAASGLDNLDLAEANGRLKLAKRGRKSNIGSDWYPVLVDYFQSRQAENTGFFYAVEVEDGKCMSIFWADDPSRLLCSQFGDTISVPFASFFGINHHKQPVLLGCALIADESEESVTWVFQTWVGAMSGCRPLSIIADQDKAIQQSIAQVFPETHQRFSMWQIKMKELEYLDALLSMNTNQTPSEFDPAWSIILQKYDLKENAWLKEMYRTRKSWVPLYIRGTFFAGIGMDGSFKSFFSSYLNAPTPLDEFEDINSFNLQVVLHAKDPKEEQGRLLCTMTMFKAFQKELLECYGYVGIKITMEGSISRYLVQKCGNGDERNTVAFNANNLTFSCSCKMFEFEGMLCRHALKIFQMVNIRELPSRYILHRWTKNAKYGILRDIDSAGSSQDFRALMLWSLREETRNYIEAGATSIERCKLAHEIMQVGKRNFCWQS
ncbi:hypothetical protein NMG60_11031604 [Bertholletia excelsa]